MAVIHFRSGKESKFSLIGDIYGHASVHQTDAAIEVGIEHKAKAIELEETMAGLIAAKEFPISLTFIYEQLHEYLYLEDRIVPYTTVNLNDDKISFQVTEYKK